MAIWNERIRKKRLEQGITLAQVADKLGVTEATAQRYESGNIKSVPYEHMCAYGELLGCSPAYLMGWITDNDTIIDYFDNTFDKVVSFLKKSGYIIVQTDSPNDDTIMIKNQKNQLIKVMSMGDLVSRYEHLRVDNLPLTVNNILNMQPSTIYPENVRAAARNMMELSPEDQKTAIDMINYLSQKSREAKKI